MPVIMIFFSAFSCPNAFKAIPTLSSVMFSISDCTLRSLIYLKLYFVQGDKYGPIWIILHTPILFDQHHLLKMLFLFQCVFFASLSEIRYPQVSGFMSVSLTIDKHDSFLYQYMQCLFLQFCLKLGNRNGGFSTVHFYFSYPGFCVCVCFHMKLRIAFSRFVKNCVGNLVGIAFNL